MKKIKFMVLLFIFLFSFLNSDYYFKYISRVKQVAENDSKDKNWKDKEIIEIWIGDSFFSVITEGKQQLIDLNKKVEYDIDHIKKTFYKNKIIKNTESDKLIKEDNQLHKDFKSHVEIKSIDETKRIGKWLCDGFSLKPKEPLDSDDDFLFELWVTRDVNIDFNLIYHVIEQSDSGSPAQLDRIVGEILKFFEINGFPIEIKSTLKSGEYTIYSSLKAMEISERTPPEWLYTVPKDYKDLKKILEASNKNRKKAGKRRRRRR